jgi:hypothetical protein
MSGVITFGNLVGLQPQFASPDHQRRPEVAMQRKHIAVAILSLVLSGCWNGVPFQFDLSGKVTPEFLIDARHEHSLGDAVQA